MNNKRSFFNAAVSIIVLSVIVGIVAYLGPIATVASSDRDHWRIAVTAMVAVLFIGSAVEFLGGLKSFKSGLRIAYRLVAIGVIMYGFAFAQYPVVASFDLWDSFWMTSGASILPIVIGGIFIYTGMRRFARLLHIRNRFTSFKLVIAMTALATAIFGILATFLETTGVEGTNIYIAVVTCASAFALFAFALAHSIAGEIGLEYRAAVRRLSYALFALGVGGMHEASTSFVVKIGQPFVDYGIYMWPFLVCSIMLVWAGYTFRQIGIYRDVRGAAGSAGHVSPGAVATDKDYLDSITAIAGLASRPQDIDPILDELRKISANLKPGASLSDHDKKQLIAVYNNVEDYLIHNDPLRKFTREELRERSRPTFAALLAAK